MNLDSPLSKLILDAGERQLFEGPLEVLAVSKGKVMFDKQENRPSLHAELSPKEERPNTSSTRISISSKLDSIPETDQFTDPSLMIAGLDDKEKIALNLLETNKSLRLRLKILKEEEIRIKSFFSAKTHLDFNFVSFVNGLNKFEPETLLEKPNEIKVDSNLLRKYVEKITRPSLSPHIQRVTIAARNSSPVGSETASYKSDDDSSYRSLRQRQKYIHEANVVYRTHSLSEKVNVDATIAEDKSESLTGGKESQTDAAVSTSNPHFKRLHSSTLRETGREGTTQTLCTQFSDSISKKSYFNRSDSEMSDFSFIDKYRHSAQTSMHKPSLSNNEKAEKNIAIASKQSSIVSYDPRDSSIQLSRAQSYTSKERPISNKFEKLNYTGIEPSTATVNKTRPISQSFSAYSSNSFSRSAPLGSDNKYNEKGLMELENQKIVSRIAAKFETASGSLRRNSMNNRGVVPQLFDSSRIVTEPANNLMASPKLTPQGVLHKGKPLCLVSKDNSVALSYEIIRK